MAIIGEAGILIRPEGVDDIPREVEGEVDGSFPGIAKKAAGFFAAAFAAVEIGGFLKDAVAEASDLSESASKVGVVFGDASDRVLAFADNAASSLGQSRAQALAATGTFGNLMRSLGLTEDASADMSIGLTGLASDLASFNNVDPDVALDALRAGLTGETEPLKQFGVNLNSAAIQAKAMELGLADASGEVSSAAQAQAVYALVMEQTSLAQGDFARTSAGLANQQRIMSAQFVDLKANIGGLFVPILGTAASAITGGIMPAVLGLTSQLPNLGNAIGAIGPAFRAALDGDDQAVVDLLNSTLGLGNGLVAAGADAGVFAGIFREAMADGKAGADLLAQDGLDGLAARAGVAAFRIRQDLASAFLSVQASVAPMWADLVSAAAPALASVRAAIGQVFAGLGGGGGGGLAGFASMIGGALNAVVPIISGVLEHFLGLAQQILPIVADLFVALIPVVQQVFAQIGPIIEQVVPILREVSGVYLNAILTALQAILPVLPTLASAFGQVVAVLGGAFVQILQQLAPIIPQIVTTIGQLAGILGTALAGVLQSLAPVLPELAQAFASIATVIAGAFMDVLQALLPVLPPLVQAIAAIAQALIGAFATALRAILPVLPTLIGALVSLFTAALQPLLPILPLLAQLLVVVVNALAPLIPPIVQVVTLLIQLAVAAITPLMPLFEILVGIVRVLLEVLTPVISIVGGIIGVFVQLASTIVSVIVGAVSGVIGAFQGLWNGITRIVGNIVSGVTTTWRGFVDGLVSVFSGIADTVGGVFSAIGGAIKSAINGVIGAINDTIIWGINKLIDGLNLVNPFDDIPHVPSIPKLHTGGTFMSGNASGEGLALLRDREVVLTPEQVQASDRLIASTRAGTSPGGTARGGDGGLVVTNNITQQPGESGTVLAARVTQGVVWNLNGGITRLIPEGATT